MISDVKHCLMYLLAISVSSFEKYLFRLVQILCPFLNQVIWSLAIKDFEFHIYIYTHIYDINFISDVWFANIFPHFIGFYCLICYAEALSVQFSSVQFSRSVMSDSL